MNTLDRLIELCEASEKVRFIRYKKNGSKLIGSTLLASKNPDTVKRLCELLKEAAPMLKEFEECGCNRVVESSMSKWLKKLEQLEKESA